MRAIFHSFENVDKGETLVVTGDSAHHLNVVRVRANESVLLLNGKGVRLTGVVKTIQKNQVEIEISNKEVLAPTHHLSLAIANPKKDAFEDILKAAVELGVKEIYPLSSEFSQYDYAPSERVDRIVESALIQSNNSFWPIVHSQTSLQDFLSNHKNTLVFFNSRANTSSKNSDILTLEKTILIGPEGGFSASEVEMISSHAKAFEIHLPTPILRAPTAVAASIGYLLASGK